MDGDPSTDGVCLKLWRDCQPEVELCLKDAFVQGLGRGDLPKHAFQHYLGQDFCYLGAYAKAYALGVAKAVQIEGTAFDVLMELLQGIKEELDMHGSYAAEWDVNLTSTRVSPTTMKYIDFLMDAAASHQGLEVMIASMLPCCRLYNFLGCQLAKKYPGHKHMYSKWIDTYSGEEFSAVCMKMEKLLEEIGRYSDYDVLLSHYRRAMVLEKEFFAAQPMSTNPRGIGMVVTDFDDTCSDGDTLELLLMALSASAAELAGGGEHAEKLIAEKLEAVTKISKDYSKAYKALLDEYLPPMVAEIKGIKAFDMEILSSVLVPLSEFERVWNQKVVDAGILSGGSRKDIINAAHNITLRAGCLPLLEKAREAGLGVHVLSVNWSAEWVAAPLGSHAAITGRQESNTEENQILVHANELIYKDAISTGDIDRTLECADDKGRIFDDLLLDRATTHGENRGKSVYIGDSPTDLLALLAADFGIVLKGNKVLQRFVKELCIEMVPIASAPIEPGPHHPPVLFEATSWQEIGEFILGGNTVLENTIPPAKVPRVLAVAGSDSGGGAGIQADLKTCLMTGSFAMTAITALTSQNTHGVHSIHETPLEELRAQMDAVLSDIGADAIKTGMLPNPDAVRVVAEMINKYNISTVVVDPVMVSTSGDSLAKDEVAEAFKKYLIPLATVLTPNIPEASALLGGQEIKDLSDMEQAAKNLHKLGPKYVLLKGGHMIQNVGAFQRVTDVLYDGEKITTLQSSVIKSGNMHGTGCTLASAIASELAKGKLPQSAVYAAREYLLKALSNSTSLCIGEGVQRPFNHGHKVVDWGKELDCGALVDPVSLRKRLAVYAVTDHDCNVKMGRNLVQAVQQAIDGGATMIQIREKHACTRDFVVDVQDVMDLGRKNGVPIIVNDRVDVALAEIADGVHVGQEDMPASDARRLIGPNKILGVSVKTVEEAVKAERDGADYIGAGAVYPTSTKDSGVIGIGVLKEICDAVQIPVVSIGGITRENAGETFQAGCAGVAVVSSIFGAADIRQATREIKSSVEAALHKRRGG